jgi:tetratricopeptide (TPR) repeat protein
VAAQRNGSGCAGGGVIVAPGPQRWGRVEEIFHRALEQPPESRDAWLDQTCEGDAELRAEVASLLDSDGAAREGFVGQKVQDAFQNLVADEAAKSAMEGRRVGSWRLVREIGRGGMGAVYLAVRADQQYESSVAIKLVRPGLDTDAIVSRFRRERQILARLDHPNITRLFDGGTTEEGIPYLVMEYVEGPWITRYAAEHRLSIEDRIRLCLPVCSAVEYAHRNFIVHRDLKPGNILIDRLGVPKLLDFGISKLLQAEALETMNTQGVGLLTPEYASPEQILGEPVTIASDVYSLGAVMYELLTGVRAHQIEHRRVLALQHACQEPVTLPSKAATDRAVARRLQGDLDNILLRAMQKEPARRYVSVEHFSDDLRRHLEHRPVVARPDSPGYRAAKFIRRNRVVVALGTLAATAVLAGAAISLREARIANERFQDVRKLATIFVFDVEEAASDLPGSLPVRQLITRTGVEYLNNLARSSAGDWALKEELGAAYLRIGRVQGGTDLSNLGDPAAAMASFVKAGKLLDEVLRHSPSDRQAILDRIVVYYEIGELRGAPGQPIDMGPPDRTGVRMAQSLLDANPKDLEAAQDAGGIHLQLSALYQGRGNFDAALSEATAAAPLLEMYAHAKPGDLLAQQTLAELKGTLGGVQLTLGRTNDAVASFRNEVELLEALLLKFPNNTLVRRSLMRAYSWLSVTLGGPERQNAGDSQGAFQAGRKSLEQAKYLYEADPTDVLAESNYGVVLMYLGLVTPPRGSEQRRTFELSEEVLSRSLVRSPQDLDILRSKSQVESQLAVICLAKGERAAGTRYYAMAIAAAEKALGSDSSNPSTQKALIVGVRGLAEEQARRGARAEALATLDRALRVAKTVDASAAPTAFLPRVNVARSWQAAGSVYAILSSREHGNQAVRDRQAARAWYRSALDEWGKLEPQKGFVAPYRRDMEAAAQALAAGGLNRPAGSLK